MTVQPANPDLFSPIDDNLEIEETASLLEVVNRLNRVTHGFTVFCVDAQKRVTGVISRGDVLRFIEINGAHEAFQTRRTARDVMTPHPRLAVEGKHYMLFIQEEGHASWYEQISRIREKHWGRWIRIKLLPVLDHDGKLANILDLDPPRTRSRLEILVMAEAFQLKPSANLGAITDQELAERRDQFDSIHYKTHWRKVEGLCDMLLKDKGGNYPMRLDVFNRARADEIVSGLTRYEEWLDGHLSVETLSAAEQDKLRRKIQQARSGLVKEYENAAAKAYVCFPPTSENVLSKPEIIVILGCTGQDGLRRRVSAALELVKAMAPTEESPVLVLSGGGHGQDLSEAQRMLELIGGVKGATMSLEETDSWKATIRGREFKVLLEEDSLDTLGNAVFSWLTLKLRQSTIGLTADTRRRRLKSLAIVTDGLHAPRSHDLFRRVFAFQNDHLLYDGPDVVVKTVAHEGAADVGARALAHLRSEAESNSNIFRLVNPLANDYDVIANGHVRSTLGQMIRLHKKYKDRWDIVRKYQGCWLPESDVNAAGGT